MSDEVYVNTREVSCKAGAGKSICAFPDVCFTPPLTPATPPGVPIPYPNTGMDADTSEGSKTVQISGKEVMLKDKSAYKTSTGDEAGSAPKKNVITSKIKGKCYYTAWSMDVKFEGENVVRHLDLMTHNHASLPGATPPWPYQYSMSPSQTKDCAEDKKKEEDACSENGAYKSADDCCKDPKCQKARNCMLVKYEGSGSKSCCEGKTGHHLLPNSLLQGKRGDSSTNVPGLTSGYTVENGACVCVDGGGHSGTHGAIHEKTKVKLRAVMETKPLTYEVAKAKCAEAHKEVFSENGKPQCSEKCIQAQIDASLQPHRSGGEINTHSKDGITRKKFEFDDED